MILSIVVPTIMGREDELEMSVEAYCQRTPVKIEWIFETGHTSCGAAWNHGVQRATGEIVHMAADDIEPETIDWFPAALLALKRGRIPIGRVREDGPSGVFGCDFARIVICRREWWRDVPEIHYWSDNAFTDLMIADGHAVMVAEGFDFYHRRSLVGRDDSPQRFEREREAYVARRDTRP